MVAYNVSGAFQEKIAACISGRMWMDNVNKDSVLNSWLGTCDYEQQGATLQTEILLLRSEEDQVPPAGSLHRRQCLVMCT